MTLRVLLVEDSPTDAKLLARELRSAGREIELTRVEDAESLRAELAAGPWDVVISDWSMPKLSGLVALGIVKESKLDVPFIIVSGTIGEETAVEAMRAGAHDYVLKDRLVRLGPAVDRELRECAARRQAAAALRESETRLRSLSESGIIGITIGDVGGRVLDANDTYLALVGFSRAELERGEIGWGDLTPPAERPLTERALAQLRASGAATPWETETLRKDGARVPILVGVAMLDPRRFIAFIADLTERKEAEAARAHLTQEAQTEHEARRRAEAALRRSEEQLRHAQKMEAVGRLAGGVAHDFNNILSVILSYGELVLGELQPEDPIRADIQEVCKAAGRAADLTRQLLLFSRHEVVEPKVLDLNQILGNMDKMLQRVVGEDVELRAILGPEVGRIRADPSHIEQVIVNLVVNARDAMPNGGKLTIETANEELDESFASSHLPAKPGPYVVLSVTDTGCGMDQATQNRIFEPFFTTKEQGKGTGLGLSTVFGIVQQSGGGLWVFSEVDHGTAFRIYLPRVDEAVTLQRVPLASTTLRGSETILLVEDEAQVRAIVRSALRRQGYEVLDASAGEEALAIAAAHPGTIHLLLTDVVMPLMSGPELAKRVAARVPGIRVLCMSGYSDDSVLRHELREAGVAFLQKPITPSLLAAKVREVLDRPEP
ncbi:MAG: response regulator [Polyangiaceae bacterium]|nr:response regulator [Polyangiaceae bacterium]